MVATPGDIGKNNDREPLIRAACQIIDKKILGAHKHERSFTFTTAVLKVSWEDLRDIADIYKKAGWYTSVESERYNEDSFVRISADEPMRYNSGNYRD